MDSAGLERLALRYVERFATTRVKLASYLARKVQERGWSDDREADPVALAERMAGLGYIDDRAFAEAKAGSLGRRGFGPRRVRDALRHAGVAESDSAEVTQDAQAGAFASALAFARRKRIGPFATVKAERPQREKQVAAMVRAGHAPQLAWRIAGMEPGEDAETFPFSD